MKYFLIADDHPAIRNGVKLILSDAFDEFEFGEAANATETLQKVKEKNWDLLILDIDMPGGKSGFDVLQQFKEQGIKIPVLVFSMHPEEQAGLRAIRLGANGYLSKSSVDAELIEAVRTVLSGRKYITPALADQMVRYIENPEDKKPHELLSEREFQTFLLLAKGKTSRQIASELSIGVPTVSTFRARILEKMQLKNNAGLVAYAINNKLIDFPNDPERPARR